MNIARANGVFTEVVEKTQVPVVTTIMGRGAIPTNHPLFIGNLGMHGAYGANMAVSECDLLFPSEQDLMTVLLESCMSLLRMHRSYILILIQHPFPEISM